MVPDRRISVVSRGAVRRGTPRGSLNGEMNRGSRKERSRARGADHPRKSPRTDRSRPRWRVGLEGRNPTSTRDLVVNEIADQQYPERVYPAREFPRQQSGRVRCVSRVMHLEEEKGGFADFFEGFV